MYSLFQITITKLCSGPKFTEYQIGELNEYTNQMQTIYFNTKVCLPKRFDVCTNLDRIWTFTYVQRPNGDIELLDLRNVKPEKYEIILENIDTIK